MCNTRGHVKLADFGSAKKILHAETKKTSYIYGTAPWAAPEVLRGESACSQSDIWYVSIVLHDVFDLFNNRSVAATVVEVMSAEFPYKRNPGIENSTTIIYLVGMNKLNPLQSTSFENLEITEDALDFLSNCFKRSV